MTQNHEKHIVTSRLNVHKTRLNGICFFSTNLSTLKHDFLSIYHYMICFVNIYKSRIMTPNLISKLRILVNITTNPLLFFPQKQKVNSFLSPN